MDSSLSNIVDHRSSLLSRFLEESWGRPYKLGEWDCILFIAAWADRMAAASCRRSCGCGILPQINLPGQSPQAPSLTEFLRGRYASEAEGIRSFAPSGVNAAVHASLLHQGWNEFVPAKGFLVGDIILTDLHHPGIWDGATILAQPARSRGLLRLHPLHARLSLRWPFWVPKKM